jgi:DNA primase
MIKKSTIDFILENVPIDQVIGEYVSLKKKGNNLFGLCPFHNEKTPSFSVSADKGIFKCFGCGESGNVINFLMKVEQLSYPEAIRFLAKKYQIPLDEDDSQIDEQKDEKEKIFIINNLALEWFKNQLWKSEEGVNNALSYLHHRGISDFIIQKFNIGYSPNSRDAFKNYALKKGYSIDDLVKAGLVVADSLADRFRGRIIFPIFNVGGRVIAFGGRSIGHLPNAAKYLNSPETLIYNKSQVLYNLNLAKKSISQQNLCYITEGYLDVISLVQAGIENVVASAGTSLTQDQIKAIHRFTNNVCLMYDADSAGVKASFRAIDMLLEEGLNVYLVSFPDGEDPDSFAHTVSTTELTDYLENNKVIFIDYKAQHLLSNNYEDPIKKAEVIRDILLSLSHISDPLIQAEYLIYISKKFNIDEFTIRDEFQRILRNKLKKEYNADSYIDNKKYNNKATYIPTSIDNKIAQHERRILFILLHYGNKMLTFEDKDENNLPITIDIPAWEFIYNELKKDDITFVSYDKIYQLIINQFKFNNNLVINDIIGYLNPDEQSLIYDLLLDTFKLSNNWKNKLKIEISTIENNEYLFNKEVECAVLEYKAIMISKLKNTKFEELKNATDEKEQEKLLLEIQILKKLENQILQTISDRNLKH